MNSKNRELQLTQKVTAIFMIVKSFNSCQIYYSTCWHWNYESGIRNTKLESTVFVNNLFSFVTFKKRISSLGRHDGAHRLVHGFDDPRLDQLLHQLDGLLPGHVAVEVGVPLKVSVEPIDRLSPGEAVVVDPHVPAVKWGNELRTRENEN